MSHHVLGPAALWIGGDHLLSCIANSLTANGLTALQVLYLMVDTFSMQVYCRMFLTVVSLITHFSSPPKSLQPVIPFQSFRNTLQEQSFITAPLSHHNPTVTPFWCYVIYYISPEYVSWVTAIPLQIGGRNTDFITALLSKFRVVFFSSGYWLYSCVTTIPLNSI